MESQENEKTKGIAKRSVETGLLAARLAKVEVGEVITYDTLGEVIGESVRSQSRGYSWLDRAKKIVQSEHGIVFDTVATIGLKRVNAVGKVAKSKHSIGKIHRESIRGMRILETVVPEELTLEQRVAFNATASHLGILRHVTRAKAAIVLESAVRTEHQQLPLAKTLEAFKKG